MRTLLATAVRSVALVALVAATATPALAFGPIGKYAKYRTFTSRDEYTSAVQGAGYTRQQVTLPAPSLTPVTSLDGGAITLSGTPTLSIGSALLLASFDRSAPARLTFAPRAGTVGFATNYNALPSQLFPSVSGEVQITPVLSTEMPVVGSGSTTVELAPVTFNPFTGDRFFGILLTVDRDALPIYEDIVRVSFEAKPHTLLGKSGLSFNQVEYAVHPPTTTVPEPATLTLLGAGLLATGLVARRRRQR